MRGQELYEDDFKADFTPEGVINREYMDSLLDEMISSRRKTFMVVDMGRSACLLAEAASQLKKRIPSLQESILEKIQFENLSDAARLQFQFYGLPVSNRRSVIVLNGITESGSEQPEGAVLLKCKKCFNMMRLTGDGMFACPSCGVHFYSDRYGNAEYYEPLYSIQK